MLRHCGIFMLFCLAVCCLFQTLLTITNAHGLEVDSPPSFTPAPQADLLSKEERAWLQAHPNIELGYTDAFEPEVIVNEDGSYSGILVEYLDALNKRLGTQINLHLDTVPGILKKAKK